MLAPDGIAQGSEPPTAPASPQAAGASLTVGETTLKLGMPKATVLSALAVEYDVDDAGIYYIISNKSDVIGTVKFDDHGVLIGAEQILTPEQRPYSEEEIGRILISRIASLASVVNDGQGCSIGASWPAPDSASPAILMWREAVIQCRGRRLVIGVLTSEKGKYFPNGLRGS
jgi:hypothetical protein